MIKAIIALDANDGIGFNNKLPWPKSEKDMKWFKSNTENSVVIMGSNTFKSLGCKTLPHRWNVVVTSQPENYPEAHETFTPTNTEKLVLKLRKLKSKYQSDVWIIGGKSLYEQTIDICEEVYVTRFNGVFECDTFLEIDKYVGPEKGFEKVLEQKEDGLSFFKFVKTSK